MELLFDDAAPGAAQLRLLEDDDRETPARFLLLVVKDFAELERLPEVSPHFALTIALDCAHVPEAEAMRVAKLLLARGLAYTCCWGAGCKNIHDAFETAYRGAGTPELPPDADAPRTTWHAQRPLEKALYYFHYCANPAPSYRIDCRDYVVATTARYAPRVRYYFS
ncbi:hypothetical protein SAMN05421819_4270 [Bryocella elongata]|uniref:DUF7684 domain-containing protein n=1 Tax=Bryocella elongata TaxID=863522 RepID=A0A1H6C703_9BACT|nr:hypothetical protein [Bryocella elongata]SEG68683.1 hypothetical protein SAMN05421819_4270 [Bryocella elongata]